VLLIFIVADAISPTINKLLMCQVILANYMTIKPAY